MRPKLSWERNTLATYLEFTRRTGQFNKDERGNVSFHAGELALTDGGLPHAFVEFVQRRGYRLTSQERELLLPGFRGDLKRYCLVLGRLEDGRYLVCYLATFNKAFHGKNISSPIGRFFSISIGKTIPWPPGYASIKVSPPWPEGSFIFGVPIVRSNLTVPKFGTSRRFMVDSGELQRLKSFIQTRIQLFDKHHKKLRQAFIQYLSLSDEALAASSDVKFTDMLAARVAAEDHVPGALDVAEERPTILPRTSDQPSYDYRVSRKIHWLKPDFYHNDGQYLIQNLRRDVMQSSLYLRGDRELKYRRVKLRSLPKPFYAPSLRVTSAKNLLRWIA
ncbi:hypothetical protein ONZ45_g10150 [Pleurotus djamor]|nr:hypothetical protein ONZ45_g10150 [Pleurotus djamor]